MNLVVDEALRRGWRRIRGQFIPTAKNGMVREFFGRFGFEKTREDSAGSAEWLLDATAYTRRVVFIRAATASTTVEYREEAQTT
jgi:predicted enzyme involved in methoxymalonyl-ACP biosynthesis